VIDKCPYCNKINCVKPIVFNNCESYGNLGLSRYDLPCQWCNEIISVLMNKKVSVYKVEKSTKKREDCDW